MYGLALIWRNALSPCSLGSSYAVVQFWAIHTVTMVLADGARAKMECAELAFYVKNRLPEAAAQEMSP